MFASSYSPHEGCIKLTDILSQSEKRCMKSIKLLEGYRLYDSAFNQSESRLKFAHNQGQNKTISNYLCAIVHLYSVGQSHSNMSSPINISVFLDNTAVRDNLLNFVENFDAGPSHYTPSTPAPTARWLRSIRRVPVRC